ncbi:torus domain-containing protein [Sarocladium implicatum]|nr:torus domain-containing protein [Sarocladium implicatum]
MATTSATTTTDLASNILHNTAPTYNFRFSPFLRREKQVGLPPDRPICRAFNTGHCPNGTRCSERHVPDPKLGNDSAATKREGGLNSLVCKHWLRGLCKKGEQCEFLHEYNLRKMPECNFFLNNGFCSNGEECLYVHTTTSKLLPCPHYDMGFCPLGPLCSKKHTRRKPCVFYLAGFCPDGPDCKEGAHMKWRTDLDKPVLMSEKKRLDEEAAAARIEKARIEQEEEMARGGGMGGQDGEGRFGGRFDRGGRGGWRGRGGRGRGFRGRH